MKKVGQKWNSPVTKMKTNCDNREKKNAGADGFCILLKDENEKRNKNIRMTTEKQNAMQFRKYLHEQWCREDDCFNLLFCSADIISHACDQFP